MLFRSVLNPGTGLLITSNRVDLGTGSINFHSGGTVWLCATGNVWTGYEQIQYGCTVRLGVDDALPTGMKLTLGNSTPGNGRFDLYGYAQTVGGLLQYGTSDSYPNNLIRNTRAGVQGTLTVSQASGVSDLFSGRIIEGVDLVKDGAANSVLTLAGTNSFTGCARVAGGTLAVASAGTLGSGCTNVTVTAGTLSLQSSVALSDGATLCLEEGGGATVNLAGGVDQSVAYLFIGGKMQRAGTYGSMSSAAANRSDVYFSGTGVLTVRLDNSGTLLKLQ